jgi:hypothetical protein
MSKADDLIREELGKGGPLLSKTANSYGPTSKSYVHPKLQAVLRNPTHDTWNDAHGVIVSPHGGMMGTTLWQAVMAVDPSFPRTGPVSDRSGKQIEGWKRIPDRVTIARALKHAATIKPRVRESAEPHVHYRNECRGCGNVIQCRCSSKNKVRETLESCFHCGGIDEGSDDVTKAEFNLPKRMHGQECEGDDCGAAPTWRCHGHHFCEADMKRHWSAMHKGPGPWSVHFKGKLNTRG